MSAQPKPLALLLLASLTFLACQFFSPAPTPAPTPLPITPTPLTVQVSAEVALDQFRPQSAFTVKFNQAMNAESITSPLAIAPYVKGEFVWNADRTEVSFTPADGFTPDQTYLVALDEKLVSVSGTQLAGLSTWQIKTLPAPHVTAREVENTNVRRPTFHLYFDRSMDLASLKAAFTVNPPAPIELSWEANHLVARATEPLAPGTVYNLTLGRAAADTRGVAMGKEYLWTYRLPPLVAGDQPAPMDFNDGMSQLVLSFNYQLEADSLIAGFQIEPSLAGQTQVSLNRLFFNPTEPWAGDTTYRVTLSRLREADGTALPAATSISFTTPLPVRAQLQYDDLNNPYLAYAFVAAVDQASVQAALEVQPPVASKFDWHGNQLLLSVEGGQFQPATPYTVTLNTTARMADGRPLLREPFIYTFTTSERVVSELSTQARFSFGQGPNAQVLDADGRRAVHFAPVSYLSEPVKEGELATFELYRLSLEQFLARYSSNFRGVAGNQSTGVSLEGAEFVTTWQTSVVNRASNDYGLNPQETFIPTEVPLGLYVLNVRSGEKADDQLLLILTRNTLMLKQAEGQVVTWLTDINGQPQPGADIGLYARDAEWLAGGQTDAAGVFSAQVARNPAPLIVVARLGDDVTVAGLNAEWRVGGYYGWWQPEPTAQDYAIYIHTERPIYRPGQRVYYKALIRRDTDAVLSVPPEGTTATVRIRDARNNVLQTTELKTNAFGTLNGEFQLGEGAMLGNYKVEVQSAGESHSQVFKVEDYRKPDYRVTVTTDQTRYVEGDSIQVTVAAEYFFGQPVANTSVTINQYDLYSNYWWDNTTDSDYYWQSLGREPISGQTDEQGRFTFTVPAPRTSSGDYYYWWGGPSRSTVGIEATLDDGSHQTVSGFARLEVFNTAEVLRLTTSGYFQTPDAPFEAIVSLTTIFDEPVANRELRLEIKGYRFRDGNYQRITLETLPVVTGPDGKAFVPITIAEPGWYDLTVIGQDRRETQLSATTWVGLYDDSGRWGGEGGLSVRADRDTYAPGDTARLIIQSPVVGPALLTFERGTVRRQQPVQLTGPVTLVEIPIQADDTPNIHVTVNVWQAQDTTLKDDSYYSLSDSNLRTASVNLKVPASDKTLSLTITPDKTTYAPRESATFKVRVTNGRGEPVSAEVSLAMVDEAIYSLSEELSGPLYDAFYHERANIVRTYHSLALSRLLWEGGGMGGGGGDDSLGTGNPRSDFPDTAAWYPTLLTDANGEATVTLNLPDSLTSWRLTAKAITLNHEVGEARTNIVVQQPIIIRPILPRALTTGDTAQLSTFIHNYSDRERQIEVIFSATGVQLNGAFQQSLTVPAGGVRVAGWSIVAKDAGEALITVTASAGEVGDAIRLPLKINPLAVPDVQVQVGEFQGELSTLLIKPEGALEISTVQIQLNRSIAGSMLNGLDYLTGFPYGCVEQTMSRALPNAVVGRAFFQLGVGNPALQADLPPKISAGLQRLYGYQHEDGGWGWWFDDNTHDYQTAWVVFGLAVTAEAGYEVDPGVISRGASWLHGNLSQMDSRTRAFALYSLAYAGHGDLAATRALAQHADELDTFSRAALALALHKLKDSNEAQRVVELLTATIVQNNGLAYWPSPEEDGHYYQKTMASTTRGTALALSALTVVRPESDLIPGVVRWVMSQRRQSGWGSTNETSFAILALTDHLLASQEASAETTYSVELNGALIASGNLGRQEPVVNVTLPAAQLQTGVNRLKLHQSGEGRLYYQINSRTYLAQSAIGAAGAITVTRSYLDRHGQPLQNVTAGQLVQVQLTVSLGQNGAFIMVEDHLPGGLEALNERLNNTSHDTRAAGYGQQYFYWQDYGYNYKEVRGDRVSFFITEFGAGTRTFTYFARATQTGEFVALPTEVSAMYDASLWGRSASATFVVRK